MSKIPDGNQGDKPKGINLSDLLPKKASVTTTIGPLYVRHAYTSDWKLFNSNDAHTLGLVALRQLCSRIESKHDSSPLDEQDIDALSEPDIQVLVPTIAKRSGWGELPSGAGCTELGNAIKVAMDKEQASHKKMLKDMRASLDSSYGFLGKSELEKLQQQMAGLADLRSAMSGTDHMQAAMRASGALDRSWRDSLPEKTELERAMSMAESAGQMNTFATPRSIEIGPIYAPPTFEETPIGRAVLESTENTREVAQNMGSLVNVVVGLNQTVIQDVLPAWVKKIEADQIAAKDAFDQAADGLKWTKYAVWASVLATVLVAWWQVHVTQTIDRQNGEQQVRIEKLMQIQLDVQQRLLDQQARDAKMLIEQQARDAAAMREAVVVQQSARPPTTTNRAAQ